MSEELAELRERYARLSLLYHVSNVIHSTLDPQEALNLILREAIQLTGASSGSVALMNPTTRCLDIEASQGLPNSALQLKLRIGEGVTGWVAKAGLPARVADVRQDARYVSARAEVCSELAVPLEVQGEVRGVLNVDSDKLDAFSAKDQELLEALAVQAAKVIHNTWIYEQLRQKARLLESLFSVGQTINSTLNLDDTLRVITSEAASLMSAKVCALHLLDPAGEWLVLRASFGASDAYVQKPPIAVAESALGIVVRRKKPLQIETVQNSAVYQHLDVARKEGLVSLLSVPLVFNGDVTGTLSIYTGGFYSFSNEEIRILSAFAELSALAIEKARLYERIVDIEEQLRQNEKLSALGLLAAEVAHEIRNPLTVMKMLYHSLDLRFPEDDPRATDVRILGEKMDALNRTVEHILDFARTVEPRLAPVNLNELLDNLNLLVRHKLQQQQITLIKQFRADLPPIMADATQLEQAFLNLILNAVQAMPAGGKLTIRTDSVSEPAPAIVVAFEDTGEGMTAEQCQRAFTSLLNSHKPGRLGLGLAIVRRVVEAHRGRLDISSQHGAGTAMTVTFPI